MRKISLWAKNHRATAIVFLIVIKLLLVVLACFTGILLQEMEIKIPAALYIAAFIILLLAVFLYPKRKSKWPAKRHFYIFQKSCDLTISLCAFIMAATLVNTNFTIAWPVNSSASTAITQPPTAAEILSSLQYRDKSTLTGQEKRILKQEFKRQLKVYAKAKITGQKKEADKALLIILTIIAAVGLLYLVAALACSLSCSGSEAAAAVVAVIGVIAVIVGAILIINRISKGPRRKRTEFIQ